MYSNKQNIYGNNNYNKTNYTNTNYKPGEKYVPRAYQNGSNQSSVSNLSNLSVNSVHKKPTLDIKSVVSFPLLGSLAKNSQNSGIDGVHNNNNNNNNNFANVLSHPVETVSVKSYPWDLPIPNYDAPVKDGYVVIKRKNGVVDFTFGESKFTENDTHHTRGLLNGSFADTLMNYRLDCYQNERYNDLNVMGASSVYAGQPTIKESIGFLHKIDRNREMRLQRELNDGEISSSSDCEIVAVEPEVGKEFVG